MMGGRRKDPIWNHFSVIRAEGKPMRAECKKCHSNMAGLVLRMRKHYNSCATEIADLTEDEGDEIESTTASRSSVTGRHI